jgi:hypothetical protein
MLYYSETCPILSKLFFCTKISFSSFAILKKYQIKNSRCTIYILVFRIALAAP